MREKREVRETRHISTNQDPSVQTPFSDGKVFPTYGKVSIYIKIYNEVSFTDETICIHNARIIGKFV